MTRQNILAFGLIYPGAALVLLAVFVMMLRRSVSSGWLRVAAGLGVVLSVLRIYFVSLLPSWGFDYTIFCSMAWLQLLEAGSSSACRGRSPADCPVRHTVSLSLRATPEEWLGWVEVELRGWCPCGPGHGLVRQISN